MITAVDGAERRMEVLGTSVDSLEERAQRLDAFGERIRVLGQDIEQRQGALEKAAEHLARGRRTTGKQPTRRASWRSSPETWGGSSVRRSHDRIAWPRSHTNSSSAPRR